MLTQLFCRLPRPLRIVVATSFALLAIAQPAHGAPAKFDVPAQPALAAVQLFGQQAGVEVLYSAADLQARTASAVKGELEPLTALQSLLAGTGLGAQQTGPSRFVVLAAPDGRPGSIEGVVRRADSSQGVENARIIVTGTGRSVVADPRGRFLITDVPAGMHTLDITAEKMVNTQLTDVTVNPSRRTLVSAIEMPAQKEGVVQMAPYVASEKRRDGVLALEALEVTEGRPKAFTTANLDLPRTRDDSLPFTTFSSAEIQASGSPGLQDFLQNRLAQNFNSDIPSELDGLGNNPTLRMSRVNLRGWGETETVFLLNGRRMVPQYQGTEIDSSNATPNLQGIPIGSVERIEILSSAAGAIYGANATGGVINIITRLDYHGGQLSFNFESPSDVFAPRRGVDLTYNRPIPFGFTLRVSAGYSASDPLRSRDRADVSIERWRGLVVERDPTRLLSRTIGAPSGATPNIRTVTTVATAGLFGPGTANFTSVPAGSNGRVGLSAYAPGVYNLALSEGESGSALQAKDSRIGVEAIDTVFNLGLDRKLGENWRLSLDYRYSQNDGVGSTPAAFNFILAGPFGATPRVPAAAPSNPFGQNVFVNLIDPKTNRPELNNDPLNTVTELTGTLRGRLGEWRGYLDFNYARNRSILPSEQFFEPYGGWTNAFLNGTYNPFVDPRVTPFAAPSFYENYIALRGILDSATRHYQAGFKASGPLFRLPTGLVELTAGVEWTRSDRYYSRTFQQFQDAATGEPRIPTGGTTSVNTALIAIDNPVRQFVFDNYAVYAETAVPVLSEKQRVPLVRSLEFTLAGRLADEERNGFTAAGVPVEYRSQPYLYSAGAKHIVFEGVTLRASRSIGFKPPTLAQVTESALPTTPFPNAVTDPRRNQTQTLAANQYRTGGNPDLDPESTRSDNIGLILNPKWLRGLRLSVDYIRSVRDNAISGIAPQAAIDLEADLPGRITRGAPDGHPSGVGPITFVDARGVNFRQISSKSLDLSAEHTLRDVRGGNLILTLTATRNFSYKVQATASSTADEQVGNPLASAAQQLEWNGNAQARWEGRRYTFGWSGRYFDDILARPTDYALQGSDRAEWAINHDLFVGYRFTGAGRWSHLLDGTSLTFGVRNVLDRAPRFWAASADRGIAPFDSLAGRTIWLQLRRNF
ncbi:MAG: hypothetical protein EXS41_08005 [Opitutaceae bacterium]|nr:hypothetical protein [Opitutaceae bacterium]